MRKWAIILAGGLTLFFCFRLSGWKIVMHSDEVAMYKTKGGWYHSCKISFGHYKWNGKGEFIHLWPSRYRGEGE